MNETEFGYRIRQALDEGADRVDYKIVLRLQQAREAALAQHQPHRRAAAGVAHGSVSEFGGGWLRLAGLAVPVLALAIGFVGIYEWQHQKRISELAALDLAVLMDFAPINTYADKSFGVLLRSEEL